MGEVRVRSEVGFELGVEMEVKVEIEFFLQPGRIQSK